MRKILAVIISAFLIVTLVACNSEVKQENETTNSIAETTVLNTEIKTEKSADASQGELIKIKNEEHTFTFRKVNFEKEYSEEFLMEILTLIPMEFGCDDYDNWGGTPNEILNDAFFGSSIWQVEGFEYGSVEWNQAVDELSNTPYEGYWGEYSFCKIENINEYLRKIYGPDVRQFEKSDFEKLNDIIECESIFDEYDLNFRYAYLPETDMIVRFANEICFGMGEATYVCDIKMEGDLYIVEAVTGSEDIRGEDTTFKGIQESALKMFNTYTYGNLTKYKFTICNEDGNLYMKKVEKSYILPDNVSKQYRVVSDGVIVEERKTVSGDWKSVAVLSQGDEVYVKEYYYFYEDYIWVISENYMGRVEKKYLTAIE